MSNQTTVHVSGIAPATTEKEVRDFFSFWYATSSPSTTKKPTNPYTTAARLSLCP